MRVARMVYGRVGVWVASLVEWLVVWLGTE